ncbi:DUF397 domain-containing protein [Streptomyces sirii]|uniref:DUF397 domain-containing protein n=1 Tax=Streptomyces sirii TaxID=3127701 RepID=UPI003D3696C0
MTKKPTACPEPAWHKSSYSSGGANCLEVAPLGPDTVTVRDSKNTTQTPLRFSNTTFTAFLLMVNSHTEF